MTWQPTQDFEVSKGIADYYSRSQLLQRLWTLGILHLNPPGKPFGYRMHCHEHGSRNLYGDLGLGNEVMESWFAESESIGRCMQ